MQFMDTQAQIIGDSDGNRAKITIQTQIPQYGYTEAVTFEDGKNHYVYLKDSASQKCSVERLPPTYNITRFIELAMDKYSGASQYIGKQLVPWTKDLFHAFEVRFDIRGSLILYFSVSTSQLLYIMIKDKPFVYHIPDGLIAKNFKDSDFMFDICPMKDNEYQIIQDLNQFSKFLK
ncbi:UNKNOWN [Stylonychia lemnae]|uniref:Uncharacterized protein n=1 Tax=Stylonychia lemnae TaxID=5949 RepID=A0A078AKK8_STYLE|nr:UNKNOWN [Stylonychia lemnae]|eukprot:CDW81977.1 UNKNOWN [Stylonychia lemnae]